MSRALKSSSQLQILNFESGFPPELASGRLPYEFANELAKRGHKVKVITVFPRKLWISKQFSLPKTRFFYWEKIGNVMVLRCWPQFKGKSLISRAIESAVLPFSLFIGGIVAGRKDVIHCQSPPLLLAFAACIIKGLTRTPVVLRIQDIHPDALVKIGLIKNKPSIRVLEILEKFLYSFVDHITVIAEGYRRNILAKGVSSDKVSLIPNWADVESIRSVANFNNFRQDSGFADKFLVTYAGTMSWPQDLETVVDSAQRLRNQKDIQFLLVGEGIKKKSLQDRSRTLNLKNVRFLGLQPREKYLQILQASDVCLVSLKKSFDSPSFPSKALEIMACSRPIIANVPLKGDISTIIQDSKCGLVVEPENANALSQAILDLHNDQIRSKELGENGRQYLEEHFSLALCISRYENIFNEVTKMGKMHG